MSYKAPWSLAVEARARKRPRGRRGLVPQARGLGGPSAPPGKQGGLGGGTPPKSKIKKLAWYPNMTNSLLRIGRSRALASTARDHGAL